MALKKKWMKFLMIMKCLENRNHRDLSNKAFKMKFRK